jgi:hypothetical protein
MILVVAEAVQRCSTERDALLSRLISNHRTIGDPDYAEQEAHLELDTFDTEILKI